MKAITFLGTGNYAQTTYIWPNDGANYTTALFPAALARFCAPSVLYAVVTPQAREKWYAALQAEAEGLGVPVQPVDIPEGHSEMDLWTIFERITGLLDEGDRVVFDITHSFRTLPFLALLAVAYVRIAKRVDVEGVYYGAYEARATDAAGQETAPVFELSRFVDMLDWITAADRFMAAGSAALLADLLRARLPDLATPVSDISLALHLLRPQEVMAGSAALVSALSAAGDPAAHVPALRPLLERIGADYGDFAAPADVGDRDALAVELKMIRWYIEKEDYLHALALEREWLPSLLCMHFKADRYDGRERADMELLLTGGKRRAATVDAEAVAVEEISPRLPLWSGVPAGKFMRRVWGGDPKYGLADVRNDALHGGFRANPQPALNIVSRCEAIYDALCQVASAYRLPHEALRRRGAASAAGGAHRHEETS